MEKYKWILLFLLLSLFACNDDDVAFEISTEDLKIDLKPVAGGAMMYYSLPNNGEIFAMNVRYSNFRGEPILKTCSYTGDSLLLDGFIQAESSVTARVSLVNHRNEESTEKEITFETKDSAPWAFLNEDNIEVAPAWNGFRLIYKPSEVVTGMAHVFYMGINPKTKQEDTLLLESFPILASGDTITFPLKQENLKNTVIVRTEDFSGYRVRQVVYSDVDAFRTEKWALTKEDFTVPRPLRPMPGQESLSFESEEAKTGVEYLFDGDLKGRERMIAGLAHAVGGRDGVVEYGAFVAGPNAFEKPFILDLREKKIPAWVRMYCLYPMKAQHPASNQELGDIWLGSYVDKLPCKVTVYGSNDKNSNEWVELGRLNQNPSATVMKDWWAYLTTQTSVLAPRDLNDFDSRDPVYVDIQLPPVNEAYQFLKFVVHDTFDTPKEGMNYNRMNCFTLQELEVYVKKEN
ncbi:MAG TPA: hypothetical protein K8V05_13635 [Butyricimonas virosa]|uniref:DUF4959 domain-containing protein n=1 Tax=Butyricimonas virosa TaxID=544645 RepID=A0A921H6M3_9BACT|nr:hypothetical protein [Butyricimonas virosa]